MEHSERRECSLFHLGRYKNKEIAVLSGKNAAEKLHEDIKCKKRRIRTHGKTNDNRGII